MNTWHCITLACRVHPDWMHDLTGPDHQISGLSESKSQHSHAAVHVWHPAHPGTVKVRQDYKCFNLFVELQNSLGSHIYCTDASLAYDVIEGLLVQPVPSCAAGPRCSLDRSFSEPPCSPILQAFAAASSCKSEPAGARSHTCIPLDCNTRHFECSTSSLETQTRWQLQQQQHAQVLRTNNNTKQEKFDLIIYLNSLVLYLCLYNVNSATLERITLSICLKRFEMLS